MRLPRDTYIPLHNVTLPAPDGTTQIDHIYVSRYGVFVIETKNMRGWIFGIEQQAQWTQKIYRKPFRFQNPLRQNYKHLKALEAALDIPADRLHSVIAFVGNCDFKTEMPANVTYGRQYIDYIQSFKEPVFSEEEISAIVERIQASRFTPSIAKHKQHVTQLKARSNPRADRLCPACGEQLMVRTVKRGVRAGEQFWGCSGYPACRVTQQLVAGVPAN
jgi:hypothetical protein